MDRWWGAAGRLSAAVDERAMRAVVAVVAVVQAGVLGLLARRGSWHDDDIDLLVVGSRGFAPDDLATPINDHVVPGLRFVYAVFAQAAPLNYDLTVLWRVLVQALAVLLMGRLLLRLLGTSWWVLAGTLLYAATPLSMPSFMNLSSGVGNLPVHVLGLLVLHATLDWFDGRRRRALLLGPVALLCALLFWEKSALILLTALALALFRRTEPHLRAWLRRAWPFALALAVPLAGFAVGYLRLRRDDPGRWPGTGVVAELLGQTMVRTVLPALTGGPWTWYTTAPPYSLASPPVVASWLGGAVVVGLLLLAVRRARRALLLWAAVAIQVIAVVVLVGYGRFESFGEVLTVNQHYWSDLSIPLVLAVVLTVRGAVPRLAGRAALAVLTLGLLTGWLAGTVVSDVNFARRWDDNPSRPFFDTLNRSIDQAGSPNLWNTEIPVLTVLSAHRRLGPILEMSRWPVRIQAADSEPAVVDNDGTIRTGQLVPWSTTIKSKPESAFCGLLLTAGESVTLPLTTPLGPAPWFARIGYFSNAEHQLRVELVDRGSDTAVPLTGTVDAWPAGGLNGMYLGPSAPTSADAVRITAPDSATNVCLGDIQIGLPEVAR